MDGFLNKIGSAVTGAANKVSQTTKELTEQTRISGEINTLRGQRDALLRQIGQLVYAHEKNGGDAPNYKEIIARIDEGDGRIAALEKQLAALKGQMSCPQCGAVIPADSAFCPKCGIGISRG